MQSDRTHDAPSPPLVEVRNLDLVFAASQQVVFRDLNLSIPNDAGRKVIALLGESGSGKSTLLELLSGATTDVSLSEEGAALSGSWRVNGHTPLENLRSNKVDFVFQDPGLLAHLTAVENIEFVRYARSSGLPVAEIRESARALLDALDVNPEDRHKRPSGLSGGTRRRVALARALVRRPRFLFLDEAFTGLDLLSRQRAWATVAAHAEEQECTIFLATHDPAEAVALADVVVLLATPPDAQSRALVLPSLTPRFRRLLTVGLFEGRDASDFSDCAAELHRSLLEFLQSHED